MYFKRCTCSGAYSSLGEIVVPLTENDESPSIEIDDDKAILTFKGIQKISTFTIPFDVQFGWDIGNKSRLFLQPGINFNFFQKGSSIVNFTQKVGEGDGPDDIWEVKGFNGLSSFKIGGSIGIGYERKISKKLSLLLNPYYRYSIGSIIEKNSVHVSPFNYGINTGLRFSF